MLTEAKSRLFFVKDRNSDKQFLVDTGAEVSVLPFNKQGPPLPPSSLTLEAANHSRIKTFGTRSVKLDFGLHRKFHWKFIVADVKFPILGTDFLRHYGLLVDVSKSRLLDATTYKRSRFNSSGTFNQPNNCGISIQVS